MCGICGAVQLHGAPLPDTLDLERMTDTMTHRGPDDRGIHLAHGVGLGARRLSIIDVAGGHQPLANETDDVWAVQNGELYNHKEIRKELEGRGHRFRTRCDTEILPHLYEEAGLAFPERLSGDYGLAVWDSKRRRLVLARDRAGVKPLYYAVQHEVLVFASELKSVLASGLLPATLDYASIETYLTLGYVLAPKTLVAGIRKLRPGERLVLENGRVALDRYWRYPEPGDPALDVSLDEAAELMEVELERAVRDRLMSDVPVGVMLSGGLDSSLVVALMARSSPQPVKTFAIGFTDSGTRSELEDARLVAQAFGTDHHELTVALADWGADLEELIWHLDEPVAEVSPLGFFALSALTRREVTVALTGQGADELLGGYLKHQAAYLVDWLERFPRPARAVIAAASGRAPARFRRTAETIRAPDAARRHLAMSGQLSPGLRRDALRGPLPARDGIDSLEEVAAYARAGKAFPAALFMDAQLALPDALLHYFDRMSMAHSLEVRVPFLDHRVIELCARLPDDAKIRGFERKRVLRRLGSKLLPPEVVSKRKVGFFRHATGGWLQAHAEDAVRRYLLDPSARCTEFLDHGFLARLAAEPDRGDPGRRRFLLSVLMLEVWLASYLPRATAATRR